MDNLIPLIGQIQLDFTDEFVIVKEAQMNNI